MRSSRSALGKDPGYHRVILLRPSARGLRLESARNVSETITRSPRETFASACCTLPAPRSSPHSPPPSPLLEFSNARVRRFPRSRRRASFPTAPRAPVRPAGGTRGINKFREAVFARAGEMSKIGIGRFVVIGAIKRRSVGRAVPWRLLLTNITGYLM